MKQSDIEKKYGKQMFKKIIELLEGCTVGIDKKTGEKEYYEHDVEWAYKIATGIIKPRWEWD